MAYDKTKLPEMYNTLDKLRKKGVDVQEIAREVQRKHPMDTFYYWTMLLHMLKDNNIAADWIYELTVAVDWFIPN